METLTGLLVRALAKHAHRPALHFDDVALSYGDVNQKSRALAAQIDCTIDRDGGRRVMGVFGNHDPDAYIGLFAGLISGITYVPMNPEFPAERLAYMAADSGMQILYIATPLSNDMLPELLARLSPSTKILAAERCDSLRSAFPELQFIELSPEHPDPRSLEHVAVNKDDCAYILYTSGSTGRPKGVKVSQGNLACYVNHMSAHYEFCDTDRFTQPHDLTFDFSVLNIYCCVCSGAELYPLSKLDKLGAVRFVRQHQLTVWTSVPSMAVQMEKLGQLRRDVMPSLRVSLFCGEPLGTRTATAWRTAVGDGIVENIYGPTEATVSCSRFSWNATASELQYHAGIVPIGMPTPGTQFAVLEGNEQISIPGTEGELCIGGEQVCLGYTDQAQTIKAFFDRPHPLNGSIVRWYKTGDRVCFNRTINSYEILGRVDHQIKLRGYRIELGEIESVIRDVYGTDAVVVIPHPVSDGVAENLIAFLETHASAPELDDVARYCKSRLPHYMCPHEFRPVNAIPLNSSGKYDRPALCRLCSQDSTR